MTDVSSRDDAAAQEAGRGHGLMPRVGIVVLNWNDYATTRRCIDSLATLPPASATVYLVDNGSVDGSMDRIEAEFAARGIVCIRNGSNLGFAAGCNPGIRRALDDGCPYVLLLNNDCILPNSDVPGRAVALAESDPACGIVGGKVLQWPDTTRIWSVGGTIGWARETFLGFGETDHGQYDRVSPRGFISGAFMLLKAELIEHLGLLPDVYFFGYEDREYCLRAQRAGFRLLYEPSAVVYHEAGKSRRAADPVYLYNDALSRILFKRRTLSPASFFLWRLTYAIHVRLLLPLLRWLSPQRFIEGARTGTLQTAALVALHDAKRADRITLEMLERFRAAHPPEPTRP